MAEITNAEYRALSELRYRIRLFLKEGDAAARSVGLEPQQYLMLLAIRGLPQNSEASIRTLAERLALKHHSTVELLDRLEKRGYVRRKRSRQDRRQVLISLLPHGERMLDEVAEARISELRSSGAELAKAIEALLERNRNGNHKTARRRGAKTTV